MSISEAKREKNCGAVVYKHLRGKLVFLIEKMNFGHYSLCKGHVEDGESEIMTAYREIKEETNLDAVIDTRFRETISYRSHRDRDDIIKDVIFFVATPVCGHVKRQKREVDDLLWLDYEAALSTLTHESDKGVLIKANEYLLALPTKKHHREDAVRLALPSREYLPSYLRAIKEYEKQKVDTYDFVDPRRCDIIKRADDFRNGRNLPEGWVSATSLWLVIGHEYIGEVSIRHALTDLLLRFGGHIGYAVRYSLWGKGYGTKMLAMALEYAKEVIGLQSVLITCNDDNGGSIRVIERNGGILQDKITNRVDGEERTTRRYWIDIK